MVFLCYACNIDSYIFNDIMFHKIIHATLLTTNSRLEGNSLTILCLNIWTPKIHNFPFRRNGKLMVLNVPIMLLCYKMCNALQVLNSFA